MAEDFTWTIQNEQDFRHALNQLGKVTSDFRIPFKIISSDFYRSQRQLFKLKSPGLFAPLGGFNPNRVVAGTQTARQRAEARKERKVGFAYPLLVGQSRDLSQSTLSASHRYSHYFLGRQELEIGTTVPYGKYHQSDKDRKKIPQRKFLFIDGGRGDKSKGSGISGRRDRWVNIVNDHIQQILTGEVL